MVILLFISIFTFHSPVQPDPSVEWLTNLEKAQAIANEKNLPILMVFSGSDWCKPCIKLKKEVFDQPHFLQNAPDHFVLLNLDFPRYKKNKLSKELAKHHSSVAEVYNPKGEFPLVLVLDPKEIIGKTGYLPIGPEKYLTHLIKLAEKSHENQ